MGETRQVIDRYYQSLKDKNESWQELWSDDGVFSDASQTLHAVGKEAVITSFTPFLKGVTDIAIAERIISDNQACYVVDYTYTNRNQETMQQKVAEVWSVQGGQLKELTIYFDLTAYRKFIQG